MLREIHDVYLRDYVKELNKQRHGGLSLEKQSAFFVTINSDLISFANKGEKLPVVIHAGKVILNLWIHGTRCLNIKKTALTETMSRCFALNQTDVRHKLKIFNKHYRDDLVNSQDVSLMYTSLIHRSAQTIAEIDKLAEIDKSEQENKEQQSSEIMKAVIAAVKEEAKERANSISNLNQNIGALQTKIESLEGDIKGKEQSNEKYEGQIKASEKTIDNLKQEIETRKQIASFDVQIHEKKEQLIPLNIERNRSVSFFKYWLIFVSEIILTLAFMAFLVMSIIKTIKEKSFSLGWVSFSMFGTLAGLCVRLKDMYLLSLACQRKNIEKNSWSIGIANILSEHNYYQI